MLVSEHSIKTDLSSEQVWRVWEDVKNWKTWDQEIEFSLLDGPFVQGATGRLKMFNSPVLETEITQMDRLKSYTFEAKLFLAKSVSTSSIEILDGAILVKFKNEIRGPLALLYAALIGPGIKRKTPHEMEEMLRVAGWFTT